MLVVLTHLLCHPRVRADTMALASARPSARPWPPRGLRDTSDAFVCSIDRNPPPNLFREIVHPNAEHRPAGFDLSMRGCFLTARSGVSWKEGIHAAHEVDAFLLLAKNGNVQKKKMSLHET